MMNLYFIQIDGNFPLTCMCAQTIYVTLIPSDIWLFRMNLSFINFLNFFFFWRFCLPSNYWTNFLSKRTAFAINISHEIIQITNLLTKFISNIALTISRKIIEPYAKPYFPTKKKDANKHKKDGRKEAEPFNVVLISAFS